MPTTILHSSESTFPNSTLIAFSFFFFSPQPRTAIWPHLKHFASHLLALGRDLGSLSHTVILSAVTPVLLCSHGDYNCTVASMQGDPSHHELLQSMFTPIYVYSYIYICIYLTLFEHSCKFISVPNGGRKILMGYL